MIRPTLSALLLAGAALLILPVQRAPGFSLIGDELTLGQRDFRIFDNFADPEANDNTTPDANFPGSSGAVMAIWKACVEWGSREARVRFAGARERPRLTYRGRVKDPLALRELLGALYDVVLADFRWRPTAQREAFQRWLVRRLDREAAAREAVEIAARTRNETKISRQSPIYRMPCPAMGDRIGTRMNTAMMKDMIRAMARPDRLSRTIATVMMRVAAAPKPCSARPASIISKLVANSDSMQPATKKLMPQYTAGLRPMLSESGPQTSWPTPSPANRMEMISWLSVGSVTPRSAPMKGSAGRTVSMARAIMDISNASRITSSARPGPSFDFVMALM